MVARTPPKQRKIVAPLNPVLLRETVKKVHIFLAQNMVQTHQPLLFLFGCVVPRKLEKKMREFSSLGL